MASRLSLATPGQHQTPRPLSRSLRGSMSSRAVAGPSSQPAGFDTHWLLQDDYNDNLPDALRFDGLSMVVRDFVEHFSAFKDGVALTAKEAAEMHARRIEEQRNGMEDLRLRTEKQKDLEKALLESIGKEEEEDKAARIQAQQLLSQRNSVAQRIQEAQAELEALQASLEKKQADKQDRATRLQRQVSRNGPELALFGRMLGCYIRAVPGQAKLLEFKFNLVNPDDPAEEARFVLDVDLRNYRVTECEPVLPAEKQNDLVAELNKSRALYTFVKKMRGAIREEVDQIRLERRSRKRKELASSTIEGRA